MAIPFILPELLRLFTRYHITNLLHCQVKTLNFKKAGINLEREEKGTWTTTVEEIYDIKSEI